MQSNLCGCTRERAREFVSDVIGIKLDSHADTLTCMLAQIQRCFGALQPVVSASKHTRM